MNTLRETALRVTAGRLRSTEAQVETVVNAYERVREELIEEHDLDERAETDQLDAEPDAEPDSVDDAPDEGGTPEIVELGNGWYEVAGEKIHGRAKAEAAAGIG